MSQLYVDNIKNRTGGAIGAPSGINVTGHTETNTLNVTGISTFNGDVKFTGSSGYGTNGIFWDESAGNLKFNEQREAQFGNNQELRIYRSIDGNSYIQDSGSGDLRIISNGSSVSIQLDTTETMGKFITNGAVELYHDNSKKFETTGYGATVTGDLQVGAGVTVYGNTGIVSAATFYGDGSQLTGISAGITTTASSPSGNTVVTLDLSSAQHHELNLSAGITTITCSGGSIGESHSVLLIQPTSGIATVGFSTYFLFPSGATPAMSEGGGKIDLLSFVAKQVGAGGTQLLASAGLNYQ